MKRDLSILLTILLVFTMGIVDIKAETNQETEVAQISETTSDSLQSKIDAIETSGTIELEEGKYVIPGFTDKEITFIGKGENTIIKRQDQSAYHRSSIYIENATIVGKEDGASYYGFQHINNETYKNCTIKGTLTMYAYQTTKFFDCTFKNESTGSAYSIWTYGAKNILFDNCKFETQNSKSVLVYQENRDDLQYITFNHCSFINNASSVGDYGAVQINAMNSGNGAYFVSINQSAQNNFKGIWGVKNKDGNGNGKSANVNITINGIGQNKETINKSGEKVFGNVDDQTKSDVPVKPEGETPTIKTNVEIHEVISSKTKMEKKDDDFKESNIVKIEPVISKLDENDSTKKEGMKRVEEKSKEVVENKFKNNEVKLNDEPISNETHEVSSYTFLDIDLVATDNNDKSANITELNEDITVTLALDETTLNEIKDADVVKVLRIHMNDEGEEETELLDAELSDGILTFNTNKFSTYVIVTFDKKTNEKSDNESKDNSNTSSDITPTKTCQKDWTWSNESQKCVYKVVNTKTK